MNRKLIHASLVLALAINAMGAWAQANLGDIPKTVDVKDVEVVSVESVIFSSHDSLVVNPATGKVDTLFVNDGMRLMTPEDEMDFEPALAPRRKVPAVTLESNARLENGGIQLAKSGAFLYVYKYPSIDADGNKIILSALMGVPRRHLQMGFAKPNNLLIACHETITNNFECPTNYNKGGSYQSAVGMMLQFTRFDRVRQPCCLVIMPDYEGYGCSVNRDHPYLYQELTARQVVDAVRYGLALYNKEMGTFSFSNFEDGWKSVSLGYSQGGSVALAVHKFIEENGLDEELHFAGSVCGDGPYDPVAHMLYYINDNGRTFHYDDDNVEYTTQHEQGTVSMPIVMPLILKGMCDSNPLMRQHSLDEYLTPRFFATGSLDMIEAKSKPNKEDQYSTEATNVKYRNQRDWGLFEVTYLNTPYEEQKVIAESFSPAEAQKMLYKDDGVNVHGKLEYMMTDKCYEYFTTPSNFEWEGERLTPTGPGFMQDLHRAMESNNLTVGWKPKHRIAFFHSPHNTVVPYDNLLSFIRNQDDLTYFFLKFRK